MSDSNPFSDEALRAFIDRETPEPMNPQYIVTVVQAARSHGIEPPTKLDTVDLTEESLLQYMRDARDPEIVAFADMTLTLANSIGIDDRDAAKSIALSTDLSDDQKLQWLDVLDEVMGNAETTGIDSKKARLHDLVEEGLRERSAQAVRKLVRAALKPELREHLRQRYGEHDSLDKIVMRIIICVNFVTHGMSVDMAEELLPTKLEGTGMTQEDVVGLFRQTIARFKEGIE